MGEVLRPRQGERPCGQTHCAPWSPAITPERQPLVAPDAARATLLGRPCRNRRRPPCPRPATVPPARSVGTQKSRLPAGCRAAGNGPSVADRGAFSAPAQGGSLLAGNGRTTELRPPGIDRRRKVSRKDGQDRAIDTQSRTDRCQGLTPSNSGRACQDLAKRGHCDVARSDFSLAHHGCGRHRISGWCPSPGQGQKSTRASAVRAAATRGSSAPTTSKSSRSRTRAASRSSPAVRRTVSTSRPKASST